MWVAAMVIELATLMVRYHSISATFGLLWHALLFVTLANVNTFSLSLYLSDSLF